MSEYSEIDLDDNDDEVIAPTKKPKMLGVPLVAEMHPDGYTGLPYLAMIQYHNKTEIVVVDNCTDTHIRAYVLDLCGPNNLDEVAFLNIVEDWYGTGSPIIPLSIELVRRGLVKQTTTILRSFNIDFVTRVIGPVFKFTAGNASTNKTRRRKRRIIQSDVDVVQS